MHSQVFVINDTSNRKRIKKLHKSLIDLSIKAAHNFFSECETFRHISTFVISSKQDELLGIIDFDRNQEHHAFQTENSSVNVITKEKIVELGWIASLVEHVHQVVILPVDITNYNNWLWNLD